MNWTGGSLQRTKTANKGVLQRQKAYFARARTQLQQSPGTPVAPFCPEYLQNDDSRELGFRLPPFESGSIHHNCQSPRHHSKVGEPAASPAARRSDHEWNLRQAQDASSHLTPGKRKSEAEKEKKRHGKRKATDGDSETQLLEANKRRLLRQQDWAGVAPSRPVDLQFLSIKEKSRIGKRRKMEGKSKACIRQRSTPIFPHQIGQDKPRGHGHTMSGALPTLTAADNIRVRFGSDALTNAASTQLNNDARSQTNSDSMLFDEEGEDAARRLESGMSQGATVCGHALAANPRSTFGQPAEFERNYPLRDGQSEHCRHHQCPEMYAEGRVQRNPAELNALDQSIQHSEASDPSYRVTYHVGSAKRPLKLTFGRGCSLCASHVASSADQISEAQCAHAGFDAEEIETRHTSRKVGEAHQSSVRKSSNPLAIVDDEPWRTYLEIGQPSFGQVCVDDGAGTSVPQPQVSARNTRADCTTWSQRHTQSNLTHVNLSKVSASLPAPKQPGGHLQHTCPRLRNSAAKDIDDCEHTWRAFVLGSDPQSAIDTIHTRSDTSDDSMSQATKGYASTRLPLSTAVTSVSSVLFPSTPFQSLSGQASCRSDDVQYAPHSGSWSITSAAPLYAVWGSDEPPGKDNAQSDEQGEEKYARSRFGEQSTPTSLQNNASYNNEMFSDTRTSCNDLDRRDRAWNDISRQAQASGSVVWQRSGNLSIRDISDSDDDAGIDLVDPDRMT